MIQNKTEYLGKAAGSVIVPFTMDINAVDTSQWRFIPIASDGSYRLVENTASFMGKDSGTVRASLNYGVNTPIYTQYGIDLDTTGGSYEITTNTNAGEISYSNNGTGQTIPASGSVDINIHNARITGSSKVVALLQYFSDGLPVILKVNVTSGLINLFIKNLDLNNAVSNFAIRFFTIN